MDLFLERDTRVLLHNNSQIANQRRAMTMDVLRYLPTSEAVTIERTSKIPLPRKTLSQRINGDRYSYLWGSGFVWRSKLEWSIPC